MASPGYRQRLEVWFGDLPLEVDDLFLLERFQLLTLRERAPKDALAAVLAADQRLRRYIITRCPELQEWIADLVAAAVPTTVEHERSVVWELADQLVYQRFPEAYDGIEELRWDVSQLAEVCEIRGRRVVDVGAGTGWLSVELARSATTVYAVEPVGRLRDYIRDRAADGGLDNLHVLDGFLDRIPLPTASVEVLVTSRAIGWRPAEELDEVERVVSPGGWAVHSLGSPTDAPREELHHLLESRGYTFSSYVDGGGVRQRYAKRIPERRSRGSAV
jgi:ubiquinone/menaquinone biosynthesis C-methylase UbiE